MKTFITKSGEVWAFEDNVTAEIAGGIFTFTESNGAQLATPADLVIYTPPPPMPNASALWSVHQAKAQVAIDKSDITMLRCVENGIAIPAAWITYRKSLRVILSATCGDSAQPLPMQPAYPAGT